MKIGAGLLLIFSAAVFAVFAGPLYAIFGYRPDFVLVAFLYLAFFWPTGPLIVLAIAVAALLDLFSLDRAAVHAVALLPAIWFVGRCRGWFILETPHLRWLVVTPVTLASAQLRAAYLAVAHGAPWLPVDALAVGAYTAAVALVVHALLDRLRDALGWQPRTARVPWR